MNYLTEFQTFNSKAELNEAITDHFDRCRFQLNETERTIFLMLARHAVKYPGVAHLKTATIAKSIGKTGRTVRRALVTLVALGMIEKVPFMRKISGGNGANLFLIVRPSTSTREVAVKTTPASVEATETETEPITLINKDLLLHNTFQFEPSLYQRFKSLLSNSIGGDNSLASRIYGVYRAQSIKLQRFDIHRDKSNLFEGLSLQALSITMQATKRKKIRSLIGYYDGVLRELIGKSLFSDAYKDYDVAPELSLCTH